MYFLFMWSPNHHRCWWPVASCPWLVLSWPNFGRHDPCESRRAQNGYFLDQTPRRNSRCPGDGFLSSSWMSRMSPCFVFFFPVKIEAWRHDMTARKMIKDDQSKVFLSFFSNWPSFALPDQCDCHVNMPQETVAKACSAWAIEWRKLGTNCWLNSSPVEPPGCWHLSVPSCTSNILWITPSQ